MALGHPFKRIVESRSTRLLSLKISRILAKLNVGLLHSTYLGSVSFELVVLNMLRRFGPYPK